MSRHVRWTIGNVLDSCCCCSLDLGMMATTFDSSCDTKILRASILFCSRAYKGDRWCRICLCVIVGCGSEEGKWINGILKFLVKIVYLHLFQISWCSYIDFIERLRSFVNHWFHSVSEMKIFNFQHWSLIKPPLPHLPVYQRVLPYTHRFAYFPYDIRNHSWSISSCAKKLFLINFNLSFRTSEQKVIWRSCTSVHKDVLCFYLNRDDLQEPMLRKNHKKKRMLLLKQICRFSIQQLT
jgi:hypothetical protein